MRGAPKTKHNGAAQTHSSHNCVCVSFTHNLTFIFAQTINHRKQLWPPPCAACTPAAAWRHLPKHSLAPHLHNNPPSFAAPGRAKPSASLHSPLPPRNLGIIKNPRGAASEPRAVPEVRIPFFCHVVLELGI